MIKDREYLIDQYTKRSRLQNGTVMINRTIAKHAKIFLEKKMLLISGPRQVGKTFLSKILAGTDHVCLSFDDEEDRRIIFDKSWPRDVSVVIFDELHKMENWKTWLKASLPRY